MILEVIVIILVVISFIGILYDKLKLHKQHQALEEKKRQLEDQLKALQGEE